MSTVSSGRLRDAGFLAFVRQHRTRLFGAAFLLHADAELAERLTQDALAHAYGHREHYLTSAVERLVRADPQTLRLPWLRAPRTELIDLEPAAVTVAGTTGPALLARLGGLHLQQRAAVIVQTFLGLPADQAAELLDVPPDQVASARTHALLALSDVLPAGSGDPALLMAAAVPRGRDVESASVEDLAHGRWLVGRRRLRRSSLVAAALAMILIVLAVVWPNPVTVVRVDGPVETESPTPSAAASAAVCTDLTKPECRVQLVRDWRSQMSEVVAGQLDPQGTYFSGYSYGYTPRYDSEQLWRDKRGALGVDLFKSRNGGTVVFLQIATSRADAIRCGSMTKHQCVHRKLMDFNFYSMTDSTSAKQGVEVQYCPEGTYVITLVAQNVTKGEQLDVTLADLLQLVQDPRLRLPTI